MVKLLNTKVTLVKNIIVFLFSFVVQFNIYGQLVINPKIILLDTCPKPQTIIIPLFKGHEQTFYKQYDNDLVSVKLKIPETFLFPIVSKNINGVGLPDQSAAGIGFFINYTTENGLALDAVFCSIRDHYGNLWFGTAGGGVSRYDGKSFTNFTKAQGLASNAVFSIAEDKSGNLWFGTYGAGVSCYDGKSFKNYTTKQGLANNYVLCIHEDTKGYIWFGTERGGISCYDGKSFKNYTTEQGLANNNVKCIYEDKSGKLWFGTGKDGVSCFDGKSFTNYLPAKKRVFNAVCGITEDKKGNIWFGMYGGGVSSFDGKTFTNYTAEQGLPSDYIRSIFLDKNGNLWFGCAYGGISQYDGKSFTNYSTAQGLANNNVRSIIEDLNGNLWFCTGGGGISRFDGKSFINYTSNLGLANNYLRSIVEDKNGNMWFGSWGGGASRYDGKSFTNFTLNQGLPNNYINSIIEDKNGNLWFGSNGGGISRYDGKSFTNFNKEQGLLNINILCIAEDHNGNLWFGTEGKGILCYSGKTFTIYDTIQGLANNTVFCIAEDKFGNIWFGTDGGGISRFDGQSFINYNTTQGLANNIVYCIKADRKGNLWFGTLGGGISRILASDLDKLQKNPNKIYSKNKFTKYIFNNINSKSGLASDVIDGIIEDKNGNIIIGTNMGFTVLIPTPVIEGGKIITPGEDTGWNIKIYNSNTGYPVKDINGGSNNMGAMYCDSKGIIWAGTGSDKTALVRFDLNAVNISKESPVLILQSLKINNENICWYDLKNKSDKLKETRQENDSLAIVNEELLAFGRPLSEIERHTMQNKFGDIQFDSITRFYPTPVNLILPYNHNNISFEYAAIMPSRPFLVKYQYILEGYDKEWNPVTNKTSASFGNITEGIYTFKLKACSPDGVWSEPITYRFKVLPPWYRTWFMYFIYALLFFLIIWGFMKWREISHKKEKEVLEQKVNLRTTQLQQAYEEIRQNISIVEKTVQIKQQFLANMSHEIRTPMNAIMGMLDMISKTDLNEIQADYIQTIQGASENLLNIINDILDLTKIEAGKMDLKISTLDIYETANKIKRLFEETAKNKKIDFSVNIDKNVVKYIKTDENRLIQIISNLVSNAFKFTKKGSIQVNISIANQNNEGILFLVEVIDTGIGITENDQMKLFTKFSQLDNTLTRSYDGTGLGLAISKELAELIGGEIGVKSEYSKGSTFWFTFTAIPSSESDYSSVRTTQPNFADMKFNLTVLLVEDKLVNQKVETLMLENVGCKVTIAKNGKEAVDIVSAGNTFDIIFMDIQMPVMDGVEAVSILRKKYNYLPPIIGLSANALEGDAERYINLGMDDYVSKPFTSAQIREKLFKWSKPKKV